MRRLVERQPVAQGVQDRAEDMPGDVPVGAHRGHDLVEPDVGCLHSFVEDVEPGRAHWYLLARAAREKSRLMNRRRLVYGTPRRPDGFGDRSENSRRQTRWAGQCTSSGKASIASPR